MAKRFIHTKYYYPVKDTNGNIYVDPFGECAEKAIFLSNFERQNYINISNSNKKKIYEFIDQNDDGRNTDKFIFVFNKSNNEIIVTTIFNKSINHLNIKL